MKLDSHITSILSQPDLLVLPGNLRYAQDFVGAGGTVQSQASGHLVLYGSSGRRILLTDPEGHPLHECEWSQNAYGQDQFISARVQLDWGQWVGIKPGHLVYETHLNLSSRPGWESISKDDLRNMAARAMNVSLEHIRFFYRDEDVAIDASGEATIRQRKDAFFILENGQFPHATFMSCMTAMHWERIDYLPVVELFLSLLPGTGSATFELIRGLYDDQNPKFPVPLQYRGIPPYPSEGAFRLFSQFFTPSAQDGVDPLRLFLDVAHSDTVTWLPSAHPPLRYLDPEHQVGVTVSDGKVVKATQALDPAGLSYSSPKPKGLPLCGRSVVSTEKSLLLQDEAQQKQLPLNATWGISSFAEPQEFPKSIPSWRTVFPDGPPQLTALQAYSAVLLYPEDERVIGEAESQPFLFDFVEDLCEEDSQLQHVVQTARHILIGGCDAALSTCVQLDSSKDFTVLYRWEHLAQKQAQALWNQCARTQKWDQLNNIRFLPYAECLQSMLEKTYDLIYFWVPFELFEQPGLPEQIMVSLEKSLRSGGVLIMSGMPMLEGLAKQLHLTTLFAEQVQQLPTFQLHQAILPKSTLYQDLMVFVFRK
ncbi:MAG: hypothetical protein ACPGYT_08585 [Nitrospirales bacterium]